jgi:hypothetical protein
MSLVEPSRTHPCIISSLSLFAWCHIGFRDPNEKVFQVELTKEIVRDYQYPFARHCCFLTYLYLIWIKALNQIGFLIALALAFDYILQICLCPRLLNREYLNRLDLYRQNVWTCKVPGKSKLTYKEALIIWTQQYSSCLLLWGWPFMTWAPPSRCLSWTACSASTRARCVCVCACTHARVLVCLCPDHI